MPIRCQSGWTIRWEMYPDAEINPAPTTNDPYLAMTVYSGANKASFTREKRLIPPYHQYKAKKTDKGAN